MPEHDNDRLEQFFRKAADKADVTFNEDDWKRLEARLDAEDAGLTHAKKGGSKIATAAVVVFILSFCGAVWVSPDLNKGANESVISAQREPLDQKVNANAERLQATSPHEHASAESDRQNDIDQDNSDIDQQNIGKSAAPPVADKESLRDNKIAGGKNSTEKATAVDESLTAGTNRQEDIYLGNISGEREAEGPAETPGNIARNVLSGSLSGVRNYDDEKIFQQLIKTPTSSAFAEKIKQKAVVELPGAEEETRGAETVVSEEHASEQKKHESWPRLSLLLSFAPDFSSTSYNEYTTPGKAFGIMVYYHMQNRWGFYAGVIQNHKRYTGDGEDYQPPKGYWKYYTNGVIPYSIDGSCSVLEFPVMVQYTIAQNAKSKWLVGAGASSYLMLSESYRYKFEDPNPGAKEGWDSRNSSRFLFNMLNFTVGYERRVFPGLMVGIEPYVKIPLEEIGWSNLKLFSTGASVTLRYTIARKQSISIPTRTRGPD